MSWFYDTSVSVSLSPSSVFMHIHACECTYVDQKIAYDMIPKVFFLDSVSHLPGVHLAS